MKVECVLTGMMRYIHDENQKGSVGQAFGIASLIFKERSI